MATQVDYYKMLGLRRNASAEQIKRAYLKLAQRLHPDKNNNPGETELFLDVQAAYETLSNPSRRIQYDATLPPEQTAPLPIITDVLYSRETLTSSQNEQLIYAMLKLAVNPNDEASYPPLNICITLDCSTSMQGEKLDMVKATAVQIIRRLRAKDVFSVVIFSDKADVIIPATLGNDTQRMENRIRMIAASGGTEIFQGLQAAYNEVKRYYNPAYVNHIILLTDGETYGDAELCHTLSETAAQEHIGISGLGIGKDWNDAFLEAISHRTGGSSIYVSGSKDIQHLLTQKFNHLTNVYITDVVLKFTMHPNVDLHYAFRMQPEAASMPVNSPIHLGPIQRDTELELLLELHIRPGYTPNNHLNILEGEIELRLPDESIENMTLNLERPISSDMNHQPPPTDIIQALSRLTLYRLQDKARIEVSEGRYDKASEHLQRLATHLLAQGERGLARTVLLEAEHIQKEKNFSDEGKKQIKYGTRALILSSKARNQ